MARSQEHEWTDLATEDFIADDYASCRVYLTLLATADTRAIER